MKSSIGILPSINTAVTIIGGGLSGLWVAYKLSSLNIKTTVITYAERDRGGVQGATIKSVGAINTSPIKKSDFKEFMDELGLGQTNNCIVSYMKDNLQNELDDFEKLFTLKDIKLGKALKGKASDLLTNLTDLYLANGGRLVNGWVTRIVVDKEQCRGVQYEDNGRIGRINTGSIIIASGGYASLFEGAVHTASYGTVIGRFVECGGITSNLEFVFKHGYGKPDLGQLTPTEELPGAEIYNNRDYHVTWLETELYNGHGTTNHLNAYKHWRKNKDEKYYIDRSYCPLYQALCACNLVPVKKAEYIGIVPDDEKINSIVSLFLPEKQNDIRKLINNKILADLEQISYEEFCDLKEHFIKKEKNIFRVQQISYFSMGGVAHDDFLTNIKNIYVTGEAMHDFGAHRVGGLPWALYLVAGGIISRNIQEKIKNGDIQEHLSDFRLIHKKSIHDKDLLIEIQHRMFSCLESEIDTQKIKKCISWFATKRRLLKSQGKELDDAYAWLLISESVMMSAENRKESRGCFYRTDYPVMSKLMDNKKTYTYLDAGTGNVMSSSFKYKLVTEEPVESSVKWSRENVL